MISKVEMLFSKFTADLFHRLYYYSPTAARINTFLGTTVHQNPIDLYIYQELIWNTRPDFIVQTGVFKGGSVLYLATMLDIIKADPSAKVFGIDIQLTPEAKKISHPRLVLLEGSSTDPAIIKQLRGMLPQGGNGFVSLDSDHSKKHVLAEMSIYSEFVGKGSYMVVEDTDINGHPVKTGFGPGPYEAVVDFLKTDKRFEPDDDVWKRHFMSFHQHGFLKRIK
jgi:cephalosporin hydroxylase